VDATQFIHNGTAAQSASFHVDGDGTIDGSFTAGNADVATDLTVGGSMGIGVPPETALHVSGDLRTDGYGGKLLFDRVMTGAWLEANATFGTSRAHTAVGASVELGTGAQLGEKLFEVPLPPPDAYAAARSYVVHATVWMEPLTGDCDPTVGLTDGTTFVGAIHMDNGNSEIGGLVQGLDGNVGTLNVVTWSSPGSPDTRRRFDLIMRLDTPVEVVLWGGRNEPPLAAVASAVLDRQQPLKLAFFGSDANEQYRFYAVRLRITEES
jgi:hypothetical protein